MPGSLPALNRCPRAHASQFLNGNRSLRALRFRDKILADAVIRVGLKSSLPTRKFLEPTMRRVRRDLLQDRSALSIPLSGRFDWFTREGLSVTVSSEIDNTKVNPKHVINLLRCWLWHCTHSKQKEVSFPVDQIRFALLRFKQLLLLVAAKIRNCLTTTDCPDRDQLLFGAPGQNTVIVSNRAKPFESSPRLLVEIVRVCDLGNRPHNNLSRQVKLRTDLLIDLQMQSVLLEGLRSPCQFTDSISRLVRQFKRLAQPFGLLFGGIQFDLGDDFHASEDINYRCDFQELKDAPGLLSYLNDNRRCRVHFFDLAL